MEKIFKYKDGPHIHDSARLIKDFEHPKSKELSF